jgi:hypothetical protein
MKQKIEGILSAFLGDCGIVFTSDVSLDQSFRDACYADASRRGFDLKLLAKPLEVGIAIGDTGYRHLENYSTRIFIAVWTGLMTHIDDYYEVYADGLKEFSSRFIRQEPQLYPVLDKVAEMSREFTEHWGPIESNLVLTAEMDFLTSMIIDSTIEGLEVSNQSRTARLLSLQLSRLTLTSPKVESSLAPGFPKFTRRMSGISKAYCCQVFPRDLNIKEWIHVIPDLQHFIDHTK